MTSPLISRRSTPSASVGGGGPFDRVRPVSATAATVFLSAGFGVLLLAYLHWQQPLLLLLVVIVATVGADRVLRLHPDSRFHGAGATTLYLFVPALFALGAALLAAAAASGFWIMPAAMLAAILFGLTVRVEYLTVDQGSDAYELARTVLLVMIYVVAFCIFTVAFVSDLSMPVAMALTAAVSFLLTLDILRELEVETSSLVINAAAGALVMAECRLTLYYLSLPDLYGSAFLFIIFYALTGLMQNGVSGRVDRKTMLTYGGFAAFAFAIVLFARLLT